MRLVVISHKPCWKKPSSPSGYATDGGFPFQMQAISELFDETSLAVPIEDALAPSGTRPLGGHNLSVLPLVMPPGRHLQRKLALFPWMLSNLGTLWQAVRQADAVHAPIPGDIGTIGILVALIQRKPLFVRYCGRWGKKETMAERFWHWLLVRIAGRKNVVLATGGGRERPAPQNPAIDWIFSTSMSREDLERLPPKQLWHRGEVLRLITVGRQETGKNTDLILRALPAILRHYPRTTLDVVGDGSQLLALQQLAERLDLVDLVTFHGNVSHQRVLSLLNRAHLFVFPTDSEGFPKAVHEALACSLPVITTGVSVLPYLIGDHNCGLILPEKTPAAIAEAVTHLAEREEQFRRMAERAQIAAQAYSLEAWRDTIGDALRTAWGPLQEDAA